MAGPIPPITLPFPRPTPSAALAQFLGERIDEWSAPLQDVAEAVLQLGQQFTLADYFRGFVEQRFGAQTNTWNGITLTQFLAILGTIYVNPGWGGLLTQFYPGTPSEVTEQAPSQSAGSTVRGFWQTLVNWVRDMVNFWWV